MSNDDVERELRASLARHAQDAPRGDLLAERIVSAADSAARASTRASAGAGAGAGAPARPRRSFGTWTLPLIAAGAVAAAAVAAVVSIQALQPQARKPVQPAATGTNQVTNDVTNQVRSTPSPTSTASVAPPRITDLSGVRILDITFAGGQAWALASAECALDPARRCTALLHSTNGRTWPSVRTSNLFNVPGVWGGCAAHCVHHLRFVNASTGYAFGPSALYLTTDGGVTWHQQPGGADALESLNDNVIRVSRQAGRVEVSRAAIGGTHWTPVTIDAAADGVALNRGRAADYLLLTTASGPSALYRSDDLGAHWQALGEPCPSARAITVAAGDGAGVSVLCAVADGSRFVATSTDFGRHFTAGDPVPTSADLLAGDPSTVLMAGGDGLSRSTSGGRGWTQIADVTGRLEFVGTESETEATAVSADGRRIWTTADAGRHWRAVTLR